MRSERGAIFGHTFGLSRRYDRGFWSNIARIIGEAIQPIKDAVNNRAGSRKTEQPGKDTLVGPNEVDSWITRSVRECASMVGATNLVANDIAQWSLSSDGFSPDPVRTYLGDGVWEINFTLGAGAGFGSVVSYASLGSITGTNGFFGGSYRVVSGSGTDMAIKFTSGDPSGHPDALVGFNDNGEWHPIEQKPITGRTRPEIQLRGSSEGGTIGAQTVVVQFKDTRFVDVFHYVSRFADQTAEGETFGTDRYSVAGVSFASIGTTANRFAPIGWGTDVAVKRPNSGVRLWSAGYDMRYSGSVTNQWLFDGAVNNIFTADTLDRTPVDIFGSWDGVDSVATGVPGTSNTLADTAVPTGTLYLGNNAAGTRPPNGVLSYLLYDRLLSSLEEQAITDWQNNEGPVAPTVVTMIADTQSGDQYVETDGVTVHTGTAGYYGAVADHGKSVADGGVWQWECVVVTGDVRARAGLSASIPVGGSGLLYGVESGSWASGSGRRSDGLMMTSEPTGQPFKAVAQGDVIGVVLDTTTKQIRIYVNGAEIGEYLQLGGVNYDDSLSWRPAIGDDQNTNGYTARAEFTTMKHPVAGAQPWAGGDVHAAFESPGVVQAISVHSDYAGPEGTVSASGELSGTYPAWHSLDRDYTTRAITNAMPSSLLFVFDKPTEITEYGIVASANESYHPRTWTLPASDDNGVTWDETDARTDVLTGDWTQGVENRYVSAAPGQYTHYKLDVTVGNYSSRFEVGDWMLYRPAMPGDLWPLIPVHTGYTSAVGTASAVSEYSTFEAWNGFDQDPDTRAIVTPVTGSLVYVFDDPVTIGAIGITSSANESYQPKDFVVEGSNDGLTWSAPLVTVTGEVTANWTYYRENRYMFTTTGEYTTYRLRTTAGNNASRFEVGDMQLYELLVW